MGRCGGRWRRRRGACSVMRAWTSSVWGTSLSTVGEGQAGRQAEEARRRPLTVSLSRLLLLVWLVCPPQTGRWTGSTTWDACPRGEAASE